MMFVETAAKYASEISVCRCDSAEQVDGKSIMQMMMLAATKGTDIHITANGSDAQQAIEELSNLVKSQFEED